MYIRYSRESDKESIERLFTACFGDSRHYPDEKLRLEVILMHYFLYVLLSSGFEFAGVIVFWFCILNLECGDLNMFIGAVMMFVLFGIQDLVNKTKYVKSLKANV